MGTPWRGWRDLFADEPGQLRRLVLLLYMVVGPLFALVVWLAAAPALRTTAGVLSALYLATALLVLGLVRTPGRRTWLLVIAVVPSVVCGVAYATSDDLALVYIILLGAPAAGSAVLFEPRTAWQALAVSTLACMLAVGYRHGVGPALLNGGGFAVVYGVVTWVGLSKSAALRAARQEVRLVAERSEAFLSAMPDAVARLDAQGRILDVRLPPGMAGRAPPGGLVGLGVEALVPPHLAGGTRAALERVARSGVPEHVEYSELTPGGPRTFQSRLVRAPGGEVVAIRQDVSALRSSEAQLSSVFAALAEGVVVQEASGRIISSNAAAQRILGLDLAALASTSSADPRFGAVREDGTPFPTDEFPVNVALRTGVGVTDVVMGVLRPDGQRRWLSVSAQPLAAGPGQAPHASAATFIDVTERKAAQERLLQAIAAANSANHLKDQFLANMSHEIRTPLNGILGLARLSEDEPSPARLQEYARIIRRSGQSLLGLINDILDFSKIEAGKLAVERIPLRLPQLLEDLLEMARIIAEEKGLRLELTRAPDLPAVVLGDPLRLRQVLSNLLANAVKFTDAGGVTLDVGRGAGEALVFTVRDTGIGIPPEAMERLFEAFSQADASTTRRFGGSGLGLAISRSLARAMGGDIEVSSQLGQGSRFTFTCPLPPASSGALQRLERLETSADQTLRAGRLQGRRVLLAEDNHVNQLLARTLLQKAGMAVTVAGDGQQAVEAVRQAGAPFDVILMDIQMPVMDGLEAARTILAELGSAAPPIIAMTADALPEHQRRSLGAGMTAHLSKPVNVDELYRVLDEAVAGRPAARA